MRFCFIYKSLFIVLLLELGLGLSALPLALARRLVVLEVEGRDGELPGHKTEDSGRIGVRFATPADLKDDTIIKIDYTGRPCNRRPVGGAAIALQRDQAAGAADDRKREAREAETAAADARVEDAWATAIWGPASSDDDMVSM